MPSYLVSYRYNSYSDVLIALGKARLVEKRLGVPAEDIRLVSEPAGIRIAYEDDARAASTEEQQGNPFFQVKDKPSREVDVENPNVWDKTRYEKGDDKPPWWKTISVINTLATPVFNNKMAQAYSPELGLQLLEDEADEKTGSMSQLLYAQASKGVNAANLGTGQGNISADAEQIVAHLGYQTGAAGFINGDYTFSIVPRPKDISLAGYRRLVGPPEGGKGFLRGYLPRATSGKVLPTRDQTVPFFMAMAYFDFILELFNYQDDPADMAAQWYGSVSDIVESLDRALYFSMGTSSAPFLCDSFAIPTWLGTEPGDGGKAATENVRDLIRETLSEHADPNLLYLPVRAFAESDPRPLLTFYRQYDPLKAPSGRKGKRLLHETTLRYIMSKTNYGELNCNAMQHFARAIRSRTLTKAYRDGQQPDFELLTKLRSAANNDDRLVSMLSEFVGSYNLRNARLSAVGKHAEGPNLRYEDLQEVIELIQKWGADFVANTLMAMAMSKRDRSEDEDATETSEPAEA